MYQVYVMYMYSICCVHYTETEYTVRTLHFLFDISLLSSQICTSVNACQSHHLPVQTLIICMCVQGGHVYVYTQISVSVYVMCLCVYHVDVCICVHVYVLAASVYLREGDVDIKKESTVNLGERRT